ncbi:MAG: arginyltransferase [Aureliella sp.]|jgi:arginine-tRNA-protein transferase
MFELTTVVDQPSICPYLDARTARMPLELPNGPVDPPQLDRLLEQGYRRSGWFYYRTACPTCQECQPLRVEVERFIESKSLRRVLRRGDRELRVSVDKPKCDAARLRLFNLHRNQRQMARDDGDATSEDYNAFLVSSWNPTIEISYWCGDRLAAVAVVDVGHSALSAVYCYFDPELEHLSLGTYSILTQVRLARVRKMRWLYLGMYVADNRHLRYKARYLPHERWQGGSWRRYEIEAQQA